MYKYKKILYFLAKDSIIISHKEGAIMDKNIIILITFILYLCIMLGIGIFFYKRTESAEDFFLGGRQLSGWVTSLSAQASDMSGWLLLGLPGYAYVAGMEAIWIALGLGIGTYLNWKFIAKRLRNYTEISGDSITLSDYFENRFRDKTKVLRVVSAFFILIFFLIYTASGFVAGGKLFHTVFGIPYIWALTIGVVVVIFYTFLGGFMAVCWTDFVQGMLMLFAILIVPTVAIKLVGGPGATIDTLKSMNVELLNAFTSTDGAKITLMSVVSLMAWGFGYFGQPHILVRFMAIRSANEIKKARSIAMSWVAISLSAAVIVGLAGRAFLSKPLEGVASETVFMVMVNDIFPAAMAGILLSAILAAIMSTADSQLLVTSSAISEDFYKALFRPNATDKELLRVSRFTVIGVAIVAYIFAMNPESSVLDLVSYAWAGFGAAFGPLVILSLYWKRMTRNGALAGMVSGGLTVLIWKQLNSFGGIFALYEIVPGFFISLIAIIIFSLLEKQPSEEIEKEFICATEK